MFRNFDKKYTSYIATLFEYKDLSNSTINFNIDYSKPNITYSQNEDGKIFIDLNLLNENIFDVEKSNIIKKAEVLCVKSILIVIFNTPHKESNIINVDNFNDIIKLLDRCNLNKN